jgi:hypothetical protein
MEWAEDNGADYIFGFAGNTTLDALVAASADNLGFQRAIRRSCALMRASCTRPEVGHSRAKWTPSSNAQRLLGHVGWK